MIFAVLTSWLACKGPQGEVGPQGAAGPTGVTGAQGSPGVPGNPGSSGATGSAGATGAQGLQGVPGAVNVLASAWVTAKAVDWRSDNDPQYFYLGFDEKNVTQSLLDKGLVMAYYRDPNQKTVVLSLPSVTDRLSIGYFLQFVNNKGTVNFDLTYFKPRTIPIDFDLEFRWVIVPSSQGGRLKAIDWKNYEEVRRELNLVD